MNTLIENPSAETIKNPSKQEVVKKNLSPLCISRLLTIRDVILKEPEAYDQQQGNVATCGTPACILGWAVTLFGDGNQKTVCEKTLLDNINYYRTATLKIGMELLELKTQMAKGLWYKEYWPYEFARAYYNNDRNIEERAKIAGKRIDHFIETDGLE